MEPERSNIREASGKIISQRNEVVEAAIKAFYGVDSAYEAIERMELTAPNDGERYSDLATGETVVEVSSIEFTWRGSEIEATFKAIGNDRVMKAIKEI